jgi:hypothetical protein
MMISALRQLHLDLEPLRDVGERSTISGVSCDADEANVAQPTTSGFPECVLPARTGKIVYPLMRYDGYGDGAGDAFGCGVDLRDFICDRMRADWAYHREELLEFWISGGCSYDLPNTNPWLLYYGKPGTRPWAWWHLEDHPPRAAGETEADYLTRHDLWLPGERECLKAQSCQAGSRRPALDWTQI